MRLLFVFVDGIGLGRSVPTNPFVGTETPGLTNILGGRQLTMDSVGYVDSRATLLGIDATLGVPGLPQSATGQASMFTGLNAAAFLGRHVNGFPEGRLRHLLSVNGMFRKLRERGYRVNFTNAYRPPFFQMLRRGLPGRRYSCSTLVSFYGGLPFHGLNAIKEERALYMDITNDILRRMGYELPLMTPEEGAERLLNISQNYDFSLFEYFLTDLAGHMADQAEASRVISILDRFIGKLTEKIDSEETMLVITSDHGNLEDLSGRNHTRNPVPALLIGNSSLRRHLESGLIDLTDLLPAIYSILEWDRDCV